ncbi:MAG TPA: transcriptional regulator [Vitreimonas sp.]|nr:transcriptional regulator [Vitreimonas sp.]
MAHEAVQIGEWTFSPGAAELTNGARKRALEHRAALVLAVLVRHRGEVVSHKDLVTQVWGGRAVSPNSIAVVIGDLRRALGDSARAPQYIETVAKRGYRLAAQSAPALAPQRRRLVALVGAGALLALAGAVFASNVRPAAIALTIAPVSNETGQAGYDALARSVGELLVSNAARNRAIRVRRAEGAVAGETSVLLSGRLILWSGHPSVSISATDISTGETIWSGIAPGPEDNLPEQVQGLMREFDGELEQRRAR